MKRLFGMLVTMFAIYFIFQFVFLYFGGGHTLEYEVETNEKKAQVTETLVQNKENDVDSYYIFVEIDDLKFDFQIYEKYFGKTKVLEDLYYYSEDNHSCLFPVFAHHGMLKDVKCYNHEDGIYYNFRDVENLSYEMQDYFENLKSYNSENFVGNQANPIREARLLVYQNNILDDHFVGLSSYTGLYTISNNNLSKIVEIPIFNSDVYTNKLRTTVGRYYVVANYDSNNAYSQLITIDLSNNRRDRIPVGTNISFESYFQGVRNGGLYIFDKDSSSQRRIDVLNNSSSEVGGVENGLLMYEGNELVDRIDAFEAIKNKVLFDEFIEYKEDGFDYKHISGFENTGYKFFVKENETGYSIYRASKQNLSMKKYILDVDDLDRVIFLNDFIYYILGNEIRYYSDVTGNRILVRNSELQFNDSIYFGVYIR